MKTFFAFLFLALALSASAFAGGSTQANLEVSEGDSEMLAALKRSYALKSKADAERASEAREKLYRDIVAELDKRIGLFTRKMRFEAAQQGNELKAYFLKNRSFPKKENCPAALVKFVAQCEKRIADAKEEARRAKAETCRKHIGIADAEMSILTAQGDYTGASEFRNFRDALEEEAEKKPAEKDSRDACEEKPRAARAGESHDGALEGRLFNLKVRADGTTVATVDRADREKRMEELRRALSLIDRYGYDFERLKREYMCAPTALYATRIFIVNEKGRALKAEQATEAFADPPVEEGGRPPFDAPGWLCCYKGKFSVPEDGEYRFVGMADDAMLVRVDRQTVFYAFWPGEKHGLAVECRSDWEPENACGRGGTDGANLRPWPHGHFGHRESLYKGSWKRLKKGVDYAIEIAIGESAGYLASACLGVQKKGRDDDENFPMFTLEPISELPSGWDVGRSGRYNTSGDFGPR